MLTVCTLLWLAAPVAVASPTAAYPPGGAVRADSPTVESEFKFELPPPRATPAATGGPGAHVFSRN
jgi:hypothetical protein